MNVTDLLWEGTLCPRERAVVDKATYNALFAKCVALREEIAKCLPEEKQALLDALEEPALAISNLTQKEAFSYGICIGMALQRESDRYLQPPSN
ncbi:MAG: hypothetical protein IJW29_04780 [Clostridia bacterium]|nr:hypothetical protein [Clostridia bacterium]